MKNGGEHRGTETQSFKAFKIRPLYLCASVFSLYHF